MHIRQVSLQYHAEADRLLLRVRSSDDHVFAVWMTRRLCLRLWPHLSTMVRHVGTAQAVAKAAPHATPTPEAAAMLADTAREQTLKQADFSQPFQAAETAQQPFGPEPMLAHVVQLTPQAGGKLQVSISDAQNRNVQLVLDDTLATAVRELMVAALRQADWGFALEAAAASDEPAARVLN
jgi:hypothetical protein